MKLVFPCLDCWNKEDNSEDITVEVEINDSGIYRFECINGHQNKEFIENEKFEMLFDLGILSLQNGFQRESVSSFASALERFYEYSIHVLLNEEIQLSLEEFEEYWKLVKISSERQLGAFYYLFLSNFNRAPILPKQKSTQFRNSVIHKGDIPSREEVIVYMNDIFKVITGNIILIKEKYPMGFSNLYKKKKERLELQTKESFGAVRFGTAIQKSTPIHILEDKDIENDLEFLTKQVHNVIYIK